MKKKNEKRFGKITSQTAKVIIWFIIAVHLQIFAQFINKFFGLREPVLRIPVGIALGFCIVISPTIPKSKALNSLYIGGIKCLLAYMIKNAMKRA